MKRDDSRPPRRPRDGERESRPRRETSSPGAPRFGPPSGKTPVERARLGPPRPRRDAGDAGGPRRSPARDDRRGRGEVEQRADRQRDERRPFRPGGPRSSAAPRRDDAPRPYRRRDDQRATRGTERERRDGAPRPYRPRDDQRATGGAARERRDGAPRPYRTRDDQRATGGAARERRDGAPRPYRTRDDQRATGGAARERRDGAPRPYRTRDDQRATGGAARERRLEGRALGAERERRDEEQPDAGPRRRRPLSSAARPTLARDERERRPWRTRDEERRAYPPRARERSDDAGPPRRGAAARRDQIHRSEAPPLAERPPELGVLYGEPYAPFVGPIVADLTHAVEDLGYEIRRVAVETIEQHRAACARVDRLYLLPFDLPAGHDDARSFVRAFFPRAEVINPPDVHDLCWDKLRANQRLLTRGVPVPETLFTESPDEVREFVAEHRFAILKERQSCGGQGHVVLCDSSDVLVGEAGRRRFVVEMGGEPGEPRRLREGVFSYPPPYFVQRLVGDAGARGVFTPGRVLRAYVVDQRIAFWTERYRDRYQRPADWIVNVALGAKVRFVLETSEELRKLALRAADVLGMRVGAIDIVRAGGGAFVLEGDTDGRHMYIDRGFKLVPEFRGAFDLDRLIAALLANEEIPALAAPM